MIKFLNKVYRHKAQILVSVQNTAVARCARCGLVYSTCRSGQLPCPGGGNASIKLRTLTGEPMPQPHTPDPTWRLALTGPAAAASSSGSSTGTGYQAGRTGRPSESGAPASTRPVSGHAAPLAVPVSLSPRELFWLVWGVTHHFECGRCHRLFSARELRQCSRHGEEAKYLPAQGVWIYGCCGQRMTQG